jgi:hypothetical protein
VISFTQTKCVDKILDAFTIASSTKKESALDADEEDATSTDQDDAIYCLLKYLGTRKYADQFALTAKDLGLPVNTEKMPPATRAAAIRR